MTIKKLTHFFLGYVEPHKESMALLKSLKSNDLRVNTTPDNSEWSFYDPVADERLLILFSSRTLFDKDMGIKYILSFSLLITDK